MSNINWTILHKTKSRFEAEALKGNLEANGIPAITIDKKDALSNTDNYVEIHVDKTRIEDAEKLMKENNSTND